MKQYLALLQDILDHGVDKADRTGTGTRSLFGAQSRYDLRAGFPLLTTKKMFTRGIIEELLWMLRGSTDVDELRSKDVHIWDQWADDHGNLGPVYGAQWRHWGGSVDAIVDGKITYAGGRDQIAELVERIKNKPDDRRLIVTAWNPDDVEVMGLPCCHCFFQCWTRELTLEEREEWSKNNEVKTLGYGILGKRHDWYTLIGVPRRGLSLQLYQRSCDVFLGVPFNIASYALLTHMLAQVTGMVALEFIHTYGDVHIYRNHMAQVAEQLTRAPKPPPRLVLSPRVRDIDAFHVEDIHIEGYESWPAIRGEVSV